MRIISFATQDTEWKTPRLGIILHTNGQDSGHRLDCEKLFAPTERPSNPLAWFDMDGPWLRRAREIAERLQRGARGFAQARATRRRGGRTAADWVRPAP